MKMPEGSTYAYELKRSHPIAAKDDDWEIEVYGPTGREQYLGHRTIDGSKVAVFTCPDGIYRAIVTHACRRDDD